MQPLSPTTALDRWSRSAGPVVKGVGPGVKRGQAGVIKIGWIGVAQRGDAVTTGPMGGGGGGGATSGPGPLGRIRTAGPWLGTGRHEESTLQTCILQRFVTLYNVSQRFTTFHNISQHYTRPLAAQAGLGCRDGGNPSPRRVWDVPGHESCPAISRL